MSEEIRAWDLSASIKRSEKLRLIKGTGTEVRAWANFNKIGKSARELDSSTNNGRRTSIVAPVSGGRNPSIGPAAYSLDWSRHFEDAELLSPKERDPDEEEPLTVSSAVDSDAPGSVEGDMFSVYFNTDTDGMISANVGKNKNGGTSTIISIMHYMNATMPWVPSVIEDVFPTMPWAFHFLEWNLRGIGQVYFCNNPISGLLILVGLFLQSTRVAVHGLIGLVAGNAFALVLGFDKGLVASGLFGYNPVLVGLAIATFVSSDKHGGYDYKIVVATIVAAALSTVLFVAMSKVLVPYKSPPFTLPFNVATGVFLFAVANMNNVSMGSVNQPALPVFDSDTDQDLISVEAFFAGTLRGIGQVFLANDLIACALILAGIGLCSRVLVAAAWGGSLIGTALAVLAGAPNDLVEQGLYSYNSSLTLAAMVLFYVPSIGSILVAMVAVILTVLVQFTLEVLLMPYGLPVMTVPFSVVTLAFILVQGTTNLFISVPLASITIPEDHVRRVNLLKDGFHLLLDAIQSSNSRSNMMKQSRSSSRMLVKMASHIEAAAATIDTTDGIGLSAVNMFKSIDASNSGDITLDQFAKYLVSIGLANETGLEFAGKAFSLMDLDGNETLDMEEFIAFAMVSHSLAQVREMIANFFDFVDNDGNNDIDIDELNAALEYLEQPALSDHEQVVLVRISGGRSSFSTSDIVNFVTISTLKDLVSAYHEKR